MKTAAVTELWEFYRDNCGGVKEPLRKRMRELDDLLADLESENAKLRELIGDMWRFTGTACKKYPRLFDPAAQGGQMVWLNAIDFFEQRMRELGIEDAS